MSSTISKAVSPWSKVDEEALALLLAQAIVPLMRDFYRILEGDLVLALVLGELGLPLCVVPRYGVLAYPSRATNVLSLSEATGIPRETVRRKVNKLILMGWAQVDERGAVAITRLPSHYLNQTNRQFFETISALLGRINAFAEKNQ